MLNYNSKDLINKQISYTKKNYSFTQFEQAFNSVFDRT
jgi:hypothetical protein